MDHAAIADKLIALINSKPWSPRRDDIVAVLAAANPPPEKFPITVTPVRDGGIHPSISLDHTGTVIVEGWSVHGGGAFSYFAPPMSAVKLAVLEFLRNQVIKEAA